MIMVFDETMTAQRISQPTFDFGPPLKDLLRTCREQTGLPAPIRLAPSYALVASS
jgi:hypothetical protein